MSPRSGGEADKFGNRYEMAWTIRHLLYVLNGEGKSVTAEDVGDIAQGVEFTYCRENGVEVHQLKRQNGNASSWTVKSLQRQEIWKYARLHVKAGREFHFVSMIPGPVLRELEDRAKRSESVNAFIKDWLAAEGYRDAFNDLCVPGTLESSEIAWEVLRGFYIICADERDVVNVNSTLAQMILEGATGDLVSAGLGDLILNNLGAELNASKIESELPKYGLRRAGIRRREGTAEQVESITLRWANNIKRMLLQPAIARAETEQLVAQLDSSASLILLTSAAGGGKTAVLYQAFKALERIGTLVLGFRLDRLDPFSSTTELGKGTGLDASPVAALASVAEGRPCVLIVDQLDAVSMVSGRMPRNFDSVADLVREVSAFPNMRVVFACRKFDVENDYRIREFLNDKDCTHIEVAELSDEQVIDAVTSMGLTASTLNIHQRKLLRFPLHLALLKTVADDTEALSFQTTKNLFDAFWQRKLQDCDQRGKPVRFNKVVSILAEAISSRQRLSVPVRVFDSEDLSLDAEILVSEHVLIRDGQQIAFFHEAFFDYVFARGWVECHETLVRFLIRGEQELFRRAQVRQIMNYLREETESDRFVTEVEELLTHPDVRYHIKEVALVLLGSLDNPTTQEWEMISSVLAECPIFEKQLWHSLRVGVVGWFERLDAEGVIEEWLAGTDKAAQARALEMMTSAARHNPDRVAQILQPHVAVEAYPSWLPLVVQFRSLHKSRLLFELLLDAVHSGQYDTAKYGLWLSAADLAKYQPKWAVELLAAYLDRPGAMQLSGKKVAALLNTDRRAIEMVQLGAAGAPRSFCDLLLPYMLQVMATTAYESNHEQSLLDEHFSSRNPKDVPYKLGDALLIGADSAIRLLVERDPATAQPILETLAANSHESAQWLLYQGIQVRGEFFAQWAIDLMLEGNHRFMSGNTSNSVWAARQVIQATSRFVDEESFRQLEESILSLRFPWEKRHPGRYVFNLLSAMDEARLSEVGRRRLGELRRMTGTEQPPEPKGITGGFIGSPIPVDAASRMNNDQWLGAIAKHDTDKINHEKSTGGALELSHVLKEYTTKNPARFAELSLQFTQSTHSAYDIAILLGFSEAEALSDPTPVFRAVRHIASLGQAANDQWLGYALRKYLKIVPIDVVKIMVERVTNTTNPEDVDPAISQSKRENKTECDLYTLGMNSTRGSAAKILGDLLIYDADGSRTELVLPILDHMATDPSIAVRSCVAHLIHASMRHARPQALNAFKQLVDADDALLATHTTVRLISHLGYKDPDTAKPVVVRMLASNLIETRQAGGQLAALATMDWGMSDLLDYVLESDDVALRKGAAEVCASELPNASDSTVALQGLYEFMVDSEEDVREAAAGVAFALRGKRLRSFEEPLSFLISSAAFPHALSQLLITLEQAPDQVDDLILKCAERFIDLYEADVGAIRTVAAGEAPDVGKLLVRAYAQSASQENSSKVLDLLDRLLLLGAYGVADIVGESER